MGRSDRWRGSDVNVFWNDLGSFIDSWGWLVIAMGLGGAGNGLARLLDGRRKRAVLKAQLAAEQRLVQRLESQLTLALEQGGNPTKITNTMLKCNSAMVDLLNRVQASDQAYPQLPYELREELDQLLRHHRLISKDLEDHPSA